MNAPSLPSVLPSNPAIQDTSTTPEQLETAGVGRVTSPTETPIFICAYSKCFRLFPSQERLIVHRKGVHSSEEMEHVISW